MEKDFQREVLDRLKAIEVKIDDYKEIKKDVSTALALAKSNEKDITELQEKIRWLTRTITGALITGAIGIVFILIKVGMGV